MTILPGRLATAYHGRQACPGPGRGHAGLRRESVNLPRHQMTLPTHIAERILLATFERFPPRELIFKASEGRAESEYDNECRMPFCRFFAQGPAMFVDKDVLDIGCGFGGRPVRYLEYGAHSVTGLEISQERWLPGVPLRNGTRLAVASGMCVAKASSCRLVTEASTLSPFMTT